MYTRKSFRKQNRNDKIKRTKKIIVFEESARVFNPAHSKSHIQPQKSSLCHYVWVRVSGCVGVLQVDENETYKLILLLVIQTVIYCNIISVLNFYSNKTIKLL